MFSEQAEEEQLIAIVKCRQINVLAERIRETLVLGAGGAADDGRERPFQRQMRRGGSFYSNPYSVRFWMRPRVRAPARASTPKSATSGMELPVAGSAAGSFCASSVTGGGVTTWAI